MMKLSFAFDSMHLFLAVLAVFLWAMTALASPEYFRGTQRRGRYYLFWAATLLALAGVFLAADLLTLFVFFEIMSFTSYVWVAHNETPQALRASQTYLFIAVIGGLTMLMGLFLLYFACGSLQFDALRAAAATLPETTKLAAGICLLVGFGAKAGMFPLHVWLPKAHPVAPAPASALLSGILTKSGVFGVIAVSANLFYGSRQWGMILLVPAVITMFLGALLAVFSTDLKKTLACSSMSQIGFILVGVSMGTLLGEEGSLAAAGATLHILNHALIKLTLFVAAGVVYFNVHALDLNAIRGFGRNKPLLLLAFVSGACSIAGVPGFGGYISKTLLHEAIVEWGQSSAVEWLFLASGGLTFAYMARLVYILFVAKKADGQREKKPYMGFGTALVLLIGAVAMPALGLTAHFSMERIAAYCSDFFHQSAMHAVAYFSLENLKGAAISIGIGVVVLLAVGFGWLTAGRGSKQRFRQVWPAWADLEELIYRPALRGLSFLGGALARLIETAAAVLVLGPVRLIFLGAKKQWQPPRDEDFGTYKRPRKQRAINRAFSADLLLAAAGLTVFLVFVLIKISI